MSFAHRDVVNAGVVAGRRSTGKSSYLDVSPRTETTSRGRPSGCNIRSTFENNSEVVNHESLAGCYKILKKLADSALAGSR